MTIDPQLQADLRRRFNPDGSPLRNLQNTMTDILREVDAVCRRNNINYWLSSGTLIGAARHGGFIPWDDDLDIEMLRSDYLRFCSIAARELPPHLVLQNSDTDPMFLLGLAKIRDSRTSIKSTSQGLEQHYRFNGVFIDILPIEPSTSYLLHRVSGKLAYWGALAVNRFNGRRGDRLVRAVTQGLNGVLRAANRLVQPLAPGKRLRHVFPSTFPRPRMIDEIFPLTEITFEGHTFMAPGNTDAYLRRIYGDWTALPDLSRLEAHTVL